MPSTHPVLVLHGGAGWRPLRGQKLEQVTKSLNLILDSVYPKLAKGMSALEAAALAASLLENDPLYNAGKGSKIQRDGKIRMSASIMDGQRRRFGGCVNVEGVKNPIMLAKSLLKRKDRTLCTVGAREFAKEKLLAFASPYTEKEKNLWKKQVEGKSGTIGAVALDRKGRLAAATSTGGRGFEYPYRVSDSATCAGNYASPLCAVSCTGVGEEIVEFAGAATVCAYVEAGIELDVAAEKLLGKARKAKAKFGLIAVDRNGRIVTDTTTQSLVWAAATNQGYAFTKA